VQRGGKSEKTPAPLEDSLDVYLYFQKMFSLGDLSHNDSSTIAATAKEFGKGQNPSLGA
jgi:hypothetical protein